MGVVVVLGLPGRCVRAGRRTGQRLRASPGGQEPGFPRGCETRRHQPPDATVMRRGRSRVLPSQLAMKHIASFSLVASLVGGLAMLATPTAQSDVPQPEVRALIDTALEQALWARAQDSDTRFRHSMTQRTRKFDGDGEVTDDETRVYAVAPYQGVPYSKLITKNGERISGDDLVVEERRWEAFLESLDNPADEDDADDFEVGFNEELIARYTATLDGVRELRGRPNYVLSFEPRPGKLPVRRRIDYALNKSQGKIWIDQATYEIARVSFQLMERVRLWWGILGSVSNATGQFDRQPIGDATWVATELDIYFQLRVLFSTTRRGENTRWSEFESIAD